MTKKKFTVCHESTGGSISVEIDFGWQLERTWLSVEAIMKDAVQFWGGYQYRLEENDFDYTKTFLKQLCQEAMVVQHEGNYNVAGVISKFQEREGWCRIDGSMGIKLLSVCGINLKPQAEYLIQEQL